MKGLRKALFASLVATCAFPLTATAEVESVEVEYSSNFPSYSGNDYKHVEGVIRGSVDRDDGTTGHYAIPFEMTYPTNGGNKTTVVDWINPFRVFTYPGVCDRGEAACDDTSSVGNILEGRTSGGARTYFRDEMWHQGTTYIGIQWYKAVTDLFGDEPPDGVRRRMVYGEIERGTDSVTILRDVTSFLRDPSTFAKGGHDVPTPTAAEKVVSVAFSFGTSFQQAFMYPSTGLNIREDGGNYYDGFFLINATSELSTFKDDGSFAVTDFAWRHPTGAFLPEDLTDTNGVKIMVVQSEADLVRFRGAFMRDYADTANVRKFELAGVSHIPSAVVDMSVWIDRVTPYLPNPVDPTPLYRGLFVQMLDWMNDGTAPADDQILGGHPTPDDGSGDVGGRTSRFYRLELGSDGNALGGLRGPHLLTEAAAGTVGAPRGVYGGFHWWYLYGEDCRPTEQLGFPTCDNRLPRGTGDGTRNDTPGLSGTYTAYSADEFSTRYPTKDDFDSAYMAAVDDLLANRFITERDRAHYAKLLEDAPEPPDPDPLPEPDPVDPPPDDGGCSVGGGSSGSFWVIALAFFGLAFNRRRD